MTPLPRRGLYAITDAALTRERGLVPCVTRALEGGAVMVQYRDKTGTPELRRQQASALLAVCRRFRAPLIINDDVHLAADTGADGVHLGREDGSIARARERLEAGAIIGASCYHDLDAATRAVGEGADYVAFGRFFPSHTKPGQARATPELLRAASAALAVPVCAIGGITADNAAGLVREGAALLAVVHGLWSAPDCRDSARALAARFD